MRAEGGPYVVEHIVQACTGVVLTGDAAAAFDGISTDSRDVKTGDLFVPLTGPNFNGHDFLLPALEAGARGSLTARDVNRDLLHNLSNYVLIQVQDTRRALSDLASAHRRTYSIPLIAVTGSSGKTTVKEMIAAVLRRSHRPLVSQANLNNLIGLPMTVLNLKQGHTAAVVEAGINVLGEMDDLARAAAPDVVVITSIGPVHLEGLGSVENVAREKFKLVRGLSPRGVAVLPADDGYLVPLTKEWGGTVLSFGMETGDVTASNVRMGDETLFRMNSPWGKHDIRLKIRGRHNIGNALASAAACLAVGAALGDVAAGLTDFLPPALRMETMALAGNRTLIRDCYNANPQSMMAALEVLSSSDLHGPRDFSSLEKRTQAGNHTNEAHGSQSRSRPVLAILGDMHELGPASDAYHQQIGAEAARLRIDRVVFVGLRAESYVKGYVTAGGPVASVTSVQDNQEAWEAVRDELGLYGTILVKGSRIMKMETIAERIVEGK
jgi:UDP-N-acetylmuramoyl-tripeptide--D-alanyl-D-alanine ligase